MDRKYWYWINNLQGVGNACIRKLLAVYDNPENVSCADKKELMRIQGISERQAEWISSPEYRQRTFEDYGRKTAEGVKFVFPGEKEYPSRLNEIYDRPFILYYSGRLPDNERHVIAVVGSRKCSGYGESVATELGSLLAKAGASVISGLASGVDSAAHRGTLYAGGNTCAVLAGGTDKCYPAGNYNLYMEIMNNGGIISEYPPGTVPCPGMFPARNRIISGMSDAVIVVEAGEKSGALITAAYALEQNRSVYAVPSRICDVTGKGSNGLIAQGAFPVTDYDTLLRDLGLAPVKQEENDKNNIRLAREEKMLYSLLLDFIPRSMESLIRESGLDAATAAGGLISLEMKGYIREKSKNFYVRIR